MVNLACYKLVSSIYLDLGVRGLTLSNAPSASPLGHPLKPEIVTYIANSTVNLYMTQVSRQRNLACFDWRGYTADDMVGTRTHLTFSIMLPPPNYQLHA